MTDDSVDSVDSDDSTDSDDLHCLHSLHCLLCLLCFNGLRIFDQLMDLLSCYDARYTTSSKNGNLNMGVMLLYSL